MSGTSIIAQIFVPLTDLDFEKVHKLLILLLADVRSFVFNFIIFVKSLTVR